MTDPIHVFVGTKAEYIKTAPLMRLLAERGIDYRLVDSGQHAAFGPGLRRRLEVKEPDVLLADRGDVSTIPAATAWALRIAGLLLSPRSRVRRRLFGGLGGTCVVHGDTPTTLLATLLARRAGLRVVHLESGLRSHRLTHPFPEELIRILVMRCAHLLFAPDETAAANLERMGVRGRVVRLPGNTVIDAIEFAGAHAGESDTVMATMHRVENLQRRDRVEGWVRLLIRVAVDHPVEFAVHEPTRITLGKGGHLTRLEAAWVALTELQPYAEFVTKIARAPFVLTDGGSIQEESAFLGVPCLLWRDRSERGDGIGENVVVSRYDDEVVEAFLADPEAHRRERRTVGVSPTAVALDALLAT